MLWVVFFRSFLFIVTQFQGIASLLTTLLYYAVVSKRQTESPKSPVMVTTPPGYKGKELKYIFHTYFSQFLVFGQKIWSIWYILLLIQQSSTFDKAFLCSKKVNLMIFQVSTNFFLDLHLYYCTHSILPFNSLGCRH